MIPLNLIPDPDADDFGKAAQLRMPYPDVVKLIGPPNRKDDPLKTDVAWGFRGPDGETGFTIWNYKNGPAYLGPKGGTIEAIAVFSVGFRDPEDEDGNEDRTSPAAKRLRKANRGLVKAIFGSNVEIPQ